MKIATHKEAVDYLESFIGKVLYKIDREYLEHHDPLERMRVLLDLLGNPQDKFKSVLIGGTSGKGSTAYLISHILTTAGYKTGLTISPHLQKINERIQINGKQISDQEFTQMVSSIVDTIELMKGMSVGAASYFEIIIAMAFLYFAQSKVDIAVVEVGMGGEFDATNTLYPLIAVLTNVSLDHTNILGKTVQAIAKTKSGIIKGFFVCHPEFISGSPACRQVCLQSNEMLKQVQHDKKKKPVVVTGAKQPSVIKIVEGKCKEVGGKLYRFGKDFDFKIKKEGLEGSVFDLTVASDRATQLNNLKLSLLGKHQIENASLAIIAVLQLKKFGFKVYEEHLRRALKKAFLPGRFEIIRVHGSVSMVYVKNHQPSAISHQLILDGAHNPTKMKAFLSTLKKLFPKEKKIFVIAFKNDKNIKGMLRQILKVTDKIVITKFHAKTDMSRRASAEALYIKNQILNIKNNKVKEISLVENSKMAMDTALKIAILNKDSIVVVTGSLYLVGEVRNML